MALPGSGATNSIAPRCRLVPSGGSCLRILSMDWTILVCDGCDRGAICSNAGRTFLDLLLEACPFSLNFLTFFSNKNDRNMKQSSSTCIHIILKCSTSGLYLLFWSDGKLSPSILLDFLHRQSCCHKQFFDV